MTSILVIFAAKRLNRLRSIKISIAPLDADLLKLNRAARRSVKKVQAGEEHAQLSIFRSEGLDVSAEFRATFIARNVVEKTWCRGRVLQRRVPERAAIVTPRLLPLSTLVGRRTKSRG